ncbi:hypothetical protein ACQKWADRAFT_299219 [Trichoderma austrokoningii]
MIMGRSSPVQADWADLPGASITNCNHQQWPHPVLDHWPVCLVPVEICRQSRARTAQHDSSARKRIATNAAGCRCQLLTRRRLMLPLLYEMAAIQHSD